MGLRGPKPLREDGCFVTGKGYLARNNPARPGVPSRGIRFEHDLVWEAANGPIPRGHDVHHINEDKFDNRIENLQLLTHLDHKRIHSGCELRDGVWWKPCSVCNAFKPVTVEHWYFAKGYPAYGRCRPCHIRIVVEAKRQRRS